jgi:hypothetical protein
LRDASQRYPDADIELFLKEIVTVNGSLQTLERPTPTPAHMLREALTQFVARKVDSRMVAAFGEVHERAACERVSRRDAAYLIAVERVAHACRQRGWV